jgi:hypothetical protein
MNNKLSKFGKIAIKYISEVNSDLTSINQSDAFNLPD